MVDFGSWKCTPHGTASGLRAQPPSAEEEVTVQIKDFGQDEEPIVAPTLYMDPVSVPEILREPSPRVLAPASRPMPEVLRESVRRGAVSPLLIGAIGLGAIAFFWRR
jgi:hypothetical protein